MPENIPQESEQWWAESTTRIDENAKSFIELFDKIEKSTQEWVLMVQDAKDGETRFLSVETRDDGKKVLKSSKSAGPSWTSTYEWSLIYDPETSSFVAEGSRNTLTDKWQVRWVDLVGTIHENPGYWWRVDLKPEEVISEMSRFWELHETALQQREELRQKKLRVMQDTYSKNDEKPEDPTSQFDQEWIV